MNPYPIGRLLALVAVLTLWPVAAGLATSQSAAERQVFIAVADESGKPVEGLTAADVALREDGQIGEIVSLAPAAEPPSIFLMVDTSIALQAVAGDARLALESFVKRVQGGSPDAMIAVMAHGAPPTMISNFTKDTASLGKSIRRVIPGRGESFLLENLIEASRQLQKRPGMRRQIVCLTLDSSREGASPRTETIVRAVRPTGSSVWAVVLSAGAADPLRDSLLNFLLTPSGGARFTVVGSVGLEKSFTALADLLLSQYVVTYRRGAGSQADRLEVTVKRPGVRVFAPQWAPK